MNAWIYRLLGSMDRSELSAPPSLIADGARTLVRLCISSQSYIHCVHHVSMRCWNDRCQFFVCEDTHCILFLVIWKVASEYLAPDVLGTLKELKVSNFRRVLKTAVYGMAQPNSEVKYILENIKSILFCCNLKVKQKIYNVLLQALSAVLSYLTDERRKHSTLLWVNLQDEQILEGNGQMFTPREAGFLQRPIPMPVQRPQELEVLPVHLCLQMFSRGLSKLICSNQPKRSHDRLSKTVIS